MSSIIGRAAFRATRPLRESGKNAGQTAPPMWKQMLHKDDREGHQVLSKGARRDPELYPLYIITGAVFVWAGFRFVRSPTGADYTDVPKAAHSEPWKDGGAESGKYMYYPHGDTSKKPKEAPSALNVTVIPNVNLPKSLHDQFNKYGKPEYDL